MSFLRYMNPELAIGGLEVGDRAVRFVELRADGSVARRAIVPLKAGAVVEGIVKDGEALAAALARLHGELYPLSRAIPAIVSVSPALVYTQIFSLPYLAGDALEDAARLNLRMLSPSDVDSSYMDWQRVGGDDVEVGAPIEALGAFADRGAIGPYHAALKRGGFVQVAIEFGSLSLARVVRAAPGLDQAGPYAVVGAGEDGITFLILSNGSPYFTRFVGWKDVAGASGDGSQEVTMERFREVVGMELRRLLDFYRSRWGGVIGKALVMNITSGKDLAQWIKSDFSLEVFVLGGYQDLDKSWLIASGAALRGGMPRGEDRFISLSPVGTEDQFLRNRVRHFVSVWARMAYAVVGCMVLVYAGLDWFAAHKEAEAVSALAAAGAMPGGAEVEALEARALGFNDLITKGLVAARAAMPRADALRAVFAAGGADIVLSSVAFDAAGRTIAVAGMAETEQRAIAFKASLTDNPLIERVDMPLSAIVSGRGGRAAFSATIVIK